jgi:ankyrin repeat protein
LIDYQLTDIQQVSRPIDVRTALHNLPSGLFEAYRRMLDRLKAVPYRWDIMRKVFMWLICTKRPIELAEIAVALAVDPEDTFFNEDKMVLPNDQAILEIGATLIRQESFSRIGFSHFSVLEFLKSPLANGRPNDYFVDVHEANVEAMKCCFAYLSFPRFFGPGTNILSYGPGPDGWDTYFSKHRSFGRSTNTLFDEWGPHRRELDFWGYAADNAFNFAKEVDNDPKRVEIIRSFLNLAQRVLPMIISLDVSSRFDTSLSPNVEIDIAGSELCAATHFGLCNVVEELLGNDECHPSSVQNAVALAVRTGHETLVGQLLHAGARATALVDDRGNSLLHVAVIWSTWHIGDDSYRRCVEIVLKHAIEESPLAVNSINQDEFTPLHMAVGASRLLNSDVNIVKALLKAGANVNAAGYRSCTSPLHVASCKPPNWLLRDHSGILNALLKAGADLERQNDGGSTALHLAGKSCNPETCIILLDAGASVSMKDAKNRTPLWYVIQSALVPHHPDYSNDFVTNPTAAYRRKGDVDQKIAFWKELIANTPRSFIPRYYVVRLLVQSDPDLLIDPCSRQMFMEILTTDSRHPAFLRSAIELIDIWKFLLSTAADIVGKENEFADLVLSLYREGMRVPFNTRTREYLDVLESYISNDLKGASL